MCTGFESCRGARTVVFVDTDDAGRISRLEVFDDWQGFPNAMGQITGLEIEALWSHDAYLSWLR